MKKLSILLIYPNKPEIAYSNLGFPLVAHLFNNSGIADCEMACIKEDGRLIPDINLKRRFDIIAFSISYELDLVNVIKLFKRHGIEIESKKRPNYPLFMAGGSVVTINPEIVANLFDIIFIGEAENNLDSIIHNIDELKKMCSKIDLLGNLNKTDGLYIPLLEAPIPYGEIKLESNYAGIKMSKSKVIEPFIYTPPIDTIFGKMHLIEAERGCGMGCKFCFTDSMYRPRKYQNKEILNNLLSNIPSNERVGLIAPNILSTPLFSTLFEQSKRLKIFLSSLRVDHLDDEWIEILKNSGQNSITISIESGSEKLRTFINKRIDIDKIFNSIQKIIDNQILNIKIYFMIGLPTEDDQDIEEMIKIIRQIHAIYLKKVKSLSRIGKLTIGVSTFIPKPHTPLALYPMQRKEDLRKKFGKIQNALSKLDNLVIHTEPIISSVFQAFINRAERMDLSILIRCAEVGEKKSSKENKARIDDLIHKQIVANQRVPWLIVKC